MKYDKLKTEIEELKSRYGFLRVSSIGTSMAGREIPLLKIGSGKRCVLYVGTHHATEHITTDVLMMLARDLCRAISSGGTICGVSAEYLSRFRSYLVVPMLNPDGTELHICGRDEKNPLCAHMNDVCGGDFSHWQANGRGVDLNHNYDAGFDEYKQKIEPSLGILGPAPTRYSGIYPESEPETSALCNFIRYIYRDMSLLLTLHTQGEEIYFDYGGKIPRRSELLARRFAAMSGYAVSRPEGAASYGGLKDWIIDEYGLPAFTLECGRGKNPLPDEDAEKIYEKIASVLVRGAIM